MKRCLLFFFLLISNYAFSNHSDNPNYLNDTIIIKKHSLLESIFPEGKFSNDSVIIRDESLFNPYGPEVIITYRTEILKEFQFDNTNEVGTLSDYLLVILASYNTRLNSNKDSTIYNTLYQGILFWKSNDGKSWKSYRQMSRFYINYDMTKTLTRIELFYDIDGYHLLMRWLDQSQNILKTRKFNAINFDPEWPF
jgi:hypothetical protein